MRSNVDEMTQWKDHGWGEMAVLAGDLGELLKRAKWRASQPAARDEIHEPDVYGDSLDLYAILERTKHGIHP